MLNNKATRNGPQLTLFKPPAHLTHNLLEFRLDVGRCLASDCALDAALVTAHGPNGHELGVRRPCYARAKLVGAPPCPEHVRISRGRHT